VRWRWKVDKLDMYRHTGQVSYREIRRYMIKIWMKDGREITYPFRADSNSAPYPFVLRFIEFVLPNPLEIRLLELFQGEKYFESYEPVNGWFKKKEVTENT
jgi:hypothetical protein